MELSLRENSAGIPVAGEAGVAGVKARPAFPAVVWVAADWGTADGVAADDAAVRDGAVFNDAVAPASCASVVVRSKVTPPLEAIGFADEVGEEAEVRAALLRAGKF